MKYSNQPIGLTTVIRVKSDNHDSWMSEAAYKAVTLEMSTGDYCTHIHREFQVSGNTLENIRFHSKVGFLDLTQVDVLDDEGEETGDAELAWCIYDGSGDLWVELMNH